MTRYQFNAYWFDQLEGRQQKRIEGVMYAKAHLPYGLTQDDALLVKLVVLLEEVVELGRSNIEGDI